MSGWEIKVGNFDTLFGIVNSLWIHDRNHDIIEESPGFGPPKNMLLSGSYQEKEHYLKCSQTEHLIITSLLIISIQFLKL